MEGRGYLYEDRIIGWSFYSVMKNTSCRRGISNKCFMRIEGYGLTTVFWKVFEWC